MPHDPQRCYYSHLLRGLRVKLLAGFCRLYPKIINGEFNRVGKKTLCLIKEYGESALFAGAI